MSTLAYTGTLEVLTCWCGIGFAIPEDLYREHLRRTDVYVTCPLGHGVRFGGKSTEARLKEAERALQDAQAQSQRRQQLLVDEREQHRRTERRLVATRGVVTRTKNRIVAGLCPKCHESFPALAEHIKEAHPDYVEKELP